MVYSTELQIGQAAGGYVIRLEGRGTARVSPTLDEVVTRYTADGQSAARIVVDLSGCRYLDSTMLGCLVTLHKKLNTDGRDRFLLAVPHDMRHKIFGATRLETFFSFAKHVPVPFEDFSPIDSICLISMEDVEFGEHVMKAHRALSQTVKEGGTVFGAVADRLAVELRQRMC